MKKPKKILAPTDFSEIGTAAVNCAADYALFFDAELHLLNVVEDYSSYYPETTMMAATEFTFDMQAMKDEAYKQLTEIEIPKASEVVRAVEIGSAPWAILQYAKQNEIDMIVISTHGRTGLKHLFLGSVAEKVVRRAPCLVMTVRPDGFEVDDAPLEVQADERARLKLSQEECETASWPGPRHRTVSG